MLSYGMRRYVVWYKFTGISEESAASILYYRGKEANVSSETSVNLHQSTRRYIPEIVIRH